jgi:hypothetical protein
MLAVRKIVDFPLKGTELSNSHEIPYVRGDHSDSQAGGAHRNQRSSSVNAMLLG